jgi:serine O-acetyltransferase
MTSTDGPLSLREQLVEDWVTHDRCVMAPGFHVVAVHRIGVWARSQSLPVRKVVGMLYKLLDVAVIRGFYGVELTRTAVLGRRVKIGHHQAIVIGDAVVIGDDCLIRQSLTLGQTGDPDRPVDQPIVGNGVQFGAGAIVIGPVRIGDGARIGPGAVVTTNVPPGAIAFAAPARVMKPAQEAS